MTYKKAPVIQSLHHGKGTPRNDLFRGVSTSKSAFKVVFFCYGSTILNGCFPGCRLFGGSLFDYRLFRGSGLFGRSFLGRGSLFCGSLFRGGGIAAGALCQQVLCPGDDLVTLGRNGVNSTCNSSQCGQNLNDLGKYFHGNIPPVSILR